VPPESHASNRLFPNASYQSSEIRTSWSTTHRRETPTHFARTCRTDLRDVVDSWTITKTIAKRTLLDHEDHAIAYRERGPHSYIS
jgi:hypothetical protein